MDDRIISIIIDKETVSDDLYLIVDLYYDNGDKIKKGDVILCFETSKSVIEVESPSSGYIYYNVEEGQKVPAGTICAALSISPKIPKNYFKKPIKEKDTSLKINSSASKNKDIRISKAAKELIKKHNLDLSIFKGKSILKRAQLRRKN